MHQGQLELLATQKTQQIMHHMKQGLPVSKCPHYITLWKEIAEQTIKTKLHFFLCNQILRFTFVGCVIKVVIHKRISSVWAPLL